MTRLSDVMEILEEIAPRAWAESWDNCGLQIGEAGMEIRAVLVSLELNDDVITESVDLGANLIVTHHPFLFKPLSSIRTDQAAGRLIRRLLTENIALYALHTNYDRAPDGINQFLARQLGIQNGEVLERSKDTLYKLVVFVPAGYEETVRTALTQAGAGKIGRYSHCTFQTTGTGSFLPEEGTSPFLGEIGRLERTEEVRLETVLPAAFRNRVLSAMIKAHPYEEVAFDLYPLVEPAGPEGLGRIGCLENPVAWEEFIERVKKIFKLDRLPVGGASPPRLVRKIAVTAGSGAGLLETAARQGAELYLTGDIKYHDYRRGEELGLTLIDVGHFSSEVLGVNHLSASLAEALLKKGHFLSVATSRALQDPYCLI